MVNDIIVIGGGIIGLSVAYEIIKKNPKLKIIILEKEDSLGFHQTGHNSGVIHSGIYYRPGSLKAKNCREGVKLLLKFCSKYDINYEICGKIIIANSKREKQALIDLKNRGLKNGIKGLKDINAEEIKEYEPYAKGSSGLYVPETGIVNYSDVVKKLFELLEEKLEFSMKAEVRSIIKDGNNLRILTNNKEFQTKFVINCSGLFSDRVARLINPNLNTCIVPFRGEYFKLKREKRYLVKNLIYPTPDPRYPFLGVHFTRHINGEIEAGPNAVLAFAREGYQKNKINFHDIWSYLSFPGFWRMAIRYYSIAFKEYYRSYYKKAFVRELQKLIPSITAGDLVSSPAGVRAQALSIEGKLIDDFVIDRQERVINIVNAPSPAATSSLSIGRKVSSLYYECS